MIFLQPADTFVNNPFIKLSSNYLGGVDHLFPAANLMLIQDFYLGKAETGVFEKLQ